MSYAHLKPGTPITISESCRAGTGPGTGRYRADTTLTLEGTGEPVDILVNHTSPYPLLPAWLVTLYAERNNRPLFLPSATVLTGPTPDDEEDEEDEYDDEEDDDRDEDDRCRNCGFIHCKCDDDNEDDDDEENYGDPLDLPSLPAGPE